VLGSLLLALCLPLMAANPAAGNAELERVIREALKPSALQSNLQRLTDEIGGRVPGTPAMEEAVAWAQDAFRAAGGENVHAEKFQIPQSWTGSKTRFSVEEPVELNLHAVSVAWGPPLKPVRHVHIVDVKDGTADDFLRAGNVAGCILLVHGKVIHTWDDLNEEYSRVPPFIERALHGKAVAIAWIAERDRDLLHRHTDTQTGELEPIPQVIVAREDGLRLARLLASGRQVYANLEISNQVGGPLTTANVVAEIRGSEHPEQFVVLGAHLDSWELGTGALDNGCNAAMVIDALRAIRASGVQPRRSIRFVLFSGEEEGLLGSEAYARQHRDELDNALAAVIFDSGSGHVSGFTLSGRTELVSAVRDLISRLTSMGVTEVTQDADMGTDNFDFLLEGVPTLVADQDAANYMQNYHAMSDTYDKVDLGNLRKEVAEAAAVVVAIANAPQRFGARQNRAQVGQLLHETHLDDTMKLVGVWPAWESGQRGRTR
ncbi:MAG TPA: M20/M25/M40 family metallo-hydrolase, partial [Terriglobales bacterium]|nr:M20/M25/M40 family metallo-hydrolase [Terriglobales bacterium]